MASLPVALIRRNTAAFRGLLVRQTTRLSSSTSLVDVPPQDLQKPAKLPDSGALETVNGFTPEVNRNRVVRITIPSRNVMQSGDFKMDRWKLTWNTEQRWENPIMGWISSSDPVQALDLSFDSKEDAIRYCEKNGWQYYVHNPNTKRRMPKSYGNNFSWDKRTRKNTK